MSSNPPIYSNGSVHGVQAYKNFVNPIDWSTMQAFIPFLYIIPTACVMIRILVLYRRAKAAMNQATMDHNIFACIMFYFLFNTLFFIGDYFHLNLPSSGIITTWCANTEPSRLYAILLIFTYSSNLAVIICPALVSLIRLTILLFPRHNERYCRLIMHRFAIPFLFIAPLILTSPNVSVTGYCRQMGSPFTFGSVMIYEGDYHGILNIYIQFSFYCFVEIMSTGMNVLIFYRLRRSTFNGSSVSQRTKTLARKAEKSLSLTMASSLVPFITSSIFAITFLFYPSKLYYAVFLRPIGNDYETVMMPWVLYLTHPMFKQKKVPKISQNSSNIWRTPNNNNNNNVNGSRSSQLC